MSHPLSNSQPASEDRHHFFGGGTAYASAKAGLNALTRGISRQHAGDGIRCCTIAPGAVQTPMLEISKQKLGEGIVAPRPGVIKPVGAPEEIAGLAAFLASDEAAYISGTIYAVWYLRALGARIGRECAVWAGGKPSLQMTEPELVTMGDRVTFDDCSIVAHINSRGRFSLNKLTIGDNCALRAGSRLLRYGSLTRLLVKLAIGGA